MIGRRGIATAPQFFFDVRRRHPIDATAPLQTDNGRLMRKLDLRYRIAISALLATFAAWLILQQYRMNPEFHSDFGLVWYGARALISGVDPYPLVGPGRTYDFGWPLYYPATSFVAAIPIAWLPESAAATLYVAVATFLLAFGITRRSWHLLPLFASEAFVSSARLGQWSLIFTAALFFPTLAALSLAKPQAALPILAASTRWRSFVAAILGGTVMIIASLILLPSWPAEWLRIVGNAEGLSMPITHFAGFMVLFVLLRWRRPESWLILVTACMPQSWGFYNTLVLFTIPGTLTEAVALLAIAAVGSGLGGFILPADLTKAGFYDWVGGIIVVSVYLPAVAIVLRRPNRGEMPAWLSWIVARRQRVPSPR